MCEFLSENGRERGGKDGDDEGDDREDQRGGGGNEFAENRGEGDRNEEGIRGGIRAGR